MTTHIALPLDPSMSTGAPIAASERLQLVDVLRGFALFGILLVNMRLFNTPLFALAAHTQPLGLLDQVAVWVIHFFAEGKFYTLFSFLFGFGFSIQFMRAEAREVDFVPVYLRRLVILLLIGLVHTTLLWYGDVLKIYAVLGCLLLLFRRCAPKTLLIWAAVCLFAIMAYNTVQIVSDMLESTPAQLPRQTADATVFAHRQISAAMHAYQAGTFSEILAVRMVENTFALCWALFTAPSMLAMFLLGLYTGRRNIFGQVAAQRTLIRRVLTWGLGLGLSGNVMYVIGSEHAGSQAPSWLDVAVMLGQTIGWPALCFCYVAGLTLLFQHATWRRRLLPLAAVGRLALTNYLLQSLVCTTIFYSYGLGFYGEVGPAAGILLTLGIFAVQVPLSMWWQRHFRFGPMEWVWRSLTYGRWQPLRA